MRAPDAETARPVTLQFMITVAAPDEPPPPLIVSVGSDVTALPKSVQTMAWMVPLAISVAVAER